MFFKLPGSLTRITRRVSSCSSTPSSAWTTSGWSPRGRSCSSSCWASIWTLKAELYQNVQGAITLLIRNPVWLLMARVMSDGVSLVRVPQCHMVKFCHNTALTGMMLTPTNKTLRSKLFQWSSRLGAVTQISERQFEFYPESHQQTGLISQHQ